MIELNKCAFHDVEKYPRELIGRGEGEVRLPLVYKKSWDDGFGVRGWKLVATIGDPEIIASTRETGEKINTSVLVHDMLDHFISGFGVSGHRSEAMALAQLSKRTGSDPRPDYKQMIKEDVMQGRVNGETMKTFLPDDMLSIIPDDHTLSGKEMIRYIKNIVGEKRLNERLLKYFMDLGESGNQHAVKSWRKLGLDPDMRTKLGLGLQRLLDIVDRYVQDSGCEYAEANVVINNEVCGFNLNLNSADTADLLFQTTLTNRH